MSDPWKTDEIEAPPMEPRLVMVAWIDEAPPGDPGRDDILRGTEGDPDLDPGVDVGNWILGDPGRENGSLPLAS
jgi:hypothetical protein